MCLLCMPKAAERKKRAAILRSEGERTTMINEAEGRAQAAMTDAEAKRKAVVLQAQAEAEAAEGQCRLRRRRRQCLEPQPAGEAG